MKHEMTPRTHEPDELPTTVIHHPELDETLLARWVRLGMEKGPSFWFLAIGTLAVIVTVGYLITGLRSGQSTTNRAWGELILASTPEDLERVAVTEEATPPGGWAALLSASSRYRDALSRLPEDREAANPLLTKALDGFRAVEERPENDPLLKRIASLAIGRALESKNELGDAIAQYEKVAKQYPDTPEAAEATRRVATLKDPRAVAFYSKFSSYVAKKGGPATLGPRKSSLPNLPLNHPDVNGPAMPAPSLFGPDPGVPAGSVPSPAPAPKAGDGLPSDVFPKTPPATPAPAPAPAPEPKAKEAAPAPGLPSDVFAPPAKADAPK